MAISPDDGASIVLHPLLFEALQRFGEAQADLAASLLVQLEAIFDKQGKLFPSSIPGGFMFELGAVAQIRHWEAIGLRPFLPPSVPTYLEAAVDLRKRVQADPLQFHTLASSSLARFILRVWLNHFAWDGQVILKADLVTGTVDEDQLVEAVAQLLWATRHSSGKQ